MEYVGNIELRAPGDMGENGESLLTAAEHVTEGMDAGVVMSGNERWHMLLIALFLDATDGQDALGQLSELYEAIWDEAFPDLGQPEMLRFSAAPTRLAPEFLGMPRRELEAEHELA